MPVTSTVWPLTVPVSLPPSRASVWPQHLEGSGCCGQLVVSLAQASYCPSFHDGTFLVRRLQVGGLSIKVPLQWPGIGMCQSGARQTLRLWAWCSCVLSWWLEGLLLPGLRGPGLPCCPRPGGPAFPLAAVLYSYNKVHLYFPKVARFPFGDWNQKTQLSKGIYIWFTWKKFCS